MTDTIPTPEELVARARALAPALRDAQTATEAARLVSPEIFEQLLDAELHKVLMPARYGGCEYGLNNYADVAFEVARGCGATGWVFAITSKYQAFLAMFPPQAQDDVWGDNRRAVTAASFTPAGTAVPTEGGYRLSGTWMYCSGVDNSNWMVVATTVPPAGGARSGVPPASGDGPGVKGYALAPTSDFSQEDNWHVVGLAGTGSKNVHCEDVFIPGHRFLTFEDTMSGDPPGAAVNTAPLYSVPLFSMISVSLCAAIMGMAQGAYDEFVDATRARVTRGAALSQPVPMAEIPTIQLRVGDAASSIDAARLLVDRDCKDIMAIINGGGRLTEMQRARNKGNLGFATHLSVQAVDRIFEASGGGGLFNAGRLQRYWRDIHAASSHISMNWDAVGALHGRIALGLPPGPAQF
jgi:resorcinol 4-hydroxylase (FADH2)